MDKNEKKNKKILKQMSNEKNKLIKKEEKESSKIPFKEKVKQATHTAKDFFIKDTSKMILLIAIVIALYLVINLWVNSINLAQIDLTKNKLHTLTEQSKNVAKNINKEITFYVWGYSESSSIVDLLKQYNSANTKINYKIVNSDDVSTINEYGFETDYPALVGVSSDGRNSYISNYDLYTYDDSYNTIDLAEQKLTNAIVNLSVDKSTKVYFIEGRSAYSTSGGIYYLTQYLSEEFYEIDTLNIVSTPAIPEDCDILAIMGVKTDFTDAETQAICNYIEKGGDIIIANDIDYINTNLSLPNFQKILDEYGVSMPNKLVMDGSTKNQVSGYNLVYQSEVSADHEITKILHNSRSVTPILVAPGMIELDTEKIIAVGYDGNKHSGKKCKPHIIGVWMDSYDGTKIVDNGNKMNDDPDNPVGCNTLTVGSFLVCKYGGIISPVSSGQEREIKESEFVGGKEAYNRVVEFEAERSDTEWQKLSIYIISFLLW